MWKVFFQRIVLYNSGFYFDMIRDIMIYFDMFLENEEKKYMRKMFFEDGGQFL